MKHIRVKQNINNNTVVTVKLPAMEFPDVISAAEFVVKQSYSDNWHKRCLPPIGEGDTLLIGETQYIFTHKGSINIPGCKLLLERRYS